MADWMDRRVEYEQSCNSQQQNLASLTLTMPTASATGGASQTAGSGASGLFVSTGAVGGAFAALAALMF